MGYSHSWAFMPDSEQFRAVFPQLVADTRQMLAHLAEHGVATAGPRGDGEPVLSDTDISFNGAGADNFETFSISIGDTYGHASPDVSPAGVEYTWSFCKTNERPYDVAVCAVLLRAHQLAPEHVALGSDGEWHDSWQHARDLIADLFEPYTGPDPLTGTDDGPLAAQTSD